jgi:hypothetical protein
MESSLVAITEAGGSHVETSFHRLVLYGELESVLSERRRVECLFDGMEFLKHESNHEDSGGLIGLEYWQTER